MFSGATCTQSAVQKPKSWPINKAYIYALLQNTVGKYVTDWNCDALAPEMPYHYN